MFLPDIQPPGRFGLDPRLDTCSIIADVGHRPKEALFGLGFCVPALVIVVCYSLIFAAIRGWVIN